MLPFGKWTGLFQVGGRENHKISIFVDVFLRYSDKLVALGERYLLDFSNGFMGLYTETF
jgi:hypothetical protein